MVLLPKALKLIANHSDVLPKRRSTSDLSA